MRAVQMRGEPQVMTCPACQGQHGSVHRMDGLPVLPCPTVTEPGALRLKFGPVDRGHKPLCYLLGPEPEPEGASDTAAQDRIASLPVAPPTLEHGRARRSA